jgi:hypothetical protein
MNEKLYPRRGLISRGLALIGGILVFGPNRSGSGETQKVKPNKRTGKVNWRAGVRQDCTEAESLDLPTQDVRRDGD